MSKRGAAIARPAFIVACYFFFIALAAYGATFISSVFAGRDWNPTYAWLLKCLLVMSVVVAFTGWWLARWNKTWATYGVTVRRVFSRQVVVGIAGGLALALLWVGALSCWTDVHWWINSGFSWTMFVASVAATLAMGIAEEVGYRTFATFTLLEHFGVVAALVVPSLVFVTAHIAGGMPWLAGVLVVGSCSILYGTLMLLTRSLPLVIGFHAANNVVEDMFIRTSSGSLFAPAYGDPNSAAQASTAIWMTIAALNAAVTVPLLMKFIAHRRRTRQPHHA